METRVASASLAVPAPPRRDAVLRLVSDEEAFIWVARRNDRSVRVHGSVPSDDDRKTILGMIKANMPDLDIEDRLEVAATPDDRQSWLGAVSFALGQAGRLRRGIVYLKQNEKENELKIEGEARSADSYEAIREALESPPNGLLLDEVELIAPSADPFAWQARLEEGSLVLSGHVTDAAARDRLLARATELSPNGSVTNRMEFASGAPEGWNDAVLAALAQVVRLENGQASLSGTAVSLEGLAADEMLAEDVIGALESGLPETFQVEANIDFHADEETDESAPSEPDSTPDDAPDRASAAQ